MSDDNEERKDDQGENVEENMSLEDMPVSYTHLRAHET